MSSGELLHHETREARGAFVERLREALSAEPSVAVAFLFGSFVRGDLREPFRDVDVGVVLDEPFTAMDVARLATRLWLATGRPRYELDVVALNDATPAFRIEVAARGVPLRERFPGAAADFAVDAWSEKLDFEAALRAIEGSA